MTLQEFQQSIREGIPAELPAPKPYDPEKTMHRNGRIS